MKQNQVYIIIGAIIFLIIASCVILFRNDIQNFFRQNKNLSTPKVQEQKEQPKNEASIKNAIQNRILCPLAIDNCEISEVYISNYQGYEYSVLGYHNSAESTPIFATFDGTIEALEIPINNEKHVNIISTDGTMLAQYKFLGPLAAEVVPGRGKIKKGHLVGFINTKLSYFDKKYNMTLSLYDKKLGKLVKFNKVQSVDGMIDLVVNK